MRDYAITAIKRRMTVVVIVVAATPVFCIWGAISYNFVCDMLP